MSDPIFSLFFFAGGVPEERAADDRADGEAAPDAAHPGEGARPARHGVDQGK